MGKYWTEEEIEERNRRVFGAPDCDLARAAEKALVQKSEAQIEAECTKLLEEDGWRPLRTDPVSDRGRGKGFGELGMADHLYLRYTFTSILAPSNQLRRMAEVLWIEFKRPGEKPKKHQVEWHTKERARGAFTLIAGEDFPPFKGGLPTYVELKNAPVKRKLATDFKV